MMAQEWPSIKRYQERIRLQEERDRKLQSVGTPDHPYVQQLTAKEREAAEGVLRGQGFSDEQIAAQVLEMDQLRVQDLPKDESAKPKQINGQLTQLKAKQKEASTQPKAIQPKLKEFSERKTQQVFQDELLKVQKMSKEELAAVITNPDFEWLPKKLQDAYIDRMLD